MENKKITSHQFFTFTGLSTLGGSILVISSSVDAGGPAGTPGFLASSHCSPAFS